MLSELCIEDALYERGFYIVDDFLSISDYQSLYQTAQTLHSKGYFKDAKIGQRQEATVNSQIRSDQIHWLDDYKDDQAIRNYFSAIEDIRMTLNRTLFLGLQDYEAHFAVYSAQTFYKKHIDQFNKTSERRVSCVYYLNNQWRSEDGGELILYQKNDQFLSQIEPHGNRFVCFNSDLPHEVLITHRTRYSITGWLKTRPK